MANVDEFKKAGLMDASCKLDPDEEDAINRLSSDEMKALISVKNKLGPVFKGKTSWPGGGVKLHVLLE